MGPTFPQFEDMWIGMDRVWNPFLEEPVGTLQVKLQMRLPVFLVVEVGDSTDSLETPLGLPWDFGTLTLCDDHAMAGSAQFTAFEGAHRNVGDSL
jgi:hypothetical protein